MDSEIKIGDLVRMDSENTRYSESTNNPRDCYGFVYSISHFTLISVRWLNGNKNGCYVIDRDLIKIPKKEKCRVTYIDGQVYIESKFLLDNFDRIPDIVPHIILSNWIRSIPKDIQSKLLGIENDPYILCSDPSWSRLYPNSQSHLDNKIKDFFNQFKKLYDRFGKIEYVNCYYKTNFLEFIFNDNEISMHNYYLDKVHNSNPSYLIEKVEIDTY